MRSLGKNVGEDGFILWGKIGGKVDVDWGGCGRKFLAHATLFLMVPKCQSTPYQSLYIYHKQ
jgi:hypothetical protein